MAKRVQVLLDDDIDGSAASETIEFSLDSNRYEIDLSAKNAKALRKALETYVSHARKVGSANSSARRSSGGTSSRRKGDTQAIREWARQNGYEVSDRGRISEEVRAAYKASQK